MISRTGSKLAIRRCAAIAACVICLFQTAWSEAAVQPAGTAAENYPNKPIRMIDAFGAGGGTDYIARLIGQKLTERFNQSVIVDNRGGAGGNIGAEIAAKATPDGYNLLMGVVPALAPSVSLYSRLPYNVMKDFAFVTLVASGTYVVLVSPSLPVKSIAELVALARSSPGKLAYGSTGVGGPAHLVGEMLKSRAGVDILQVAYKGGSPAIFTAIANGEVQISYLNIAAVLPMMRTGRVRALAVTAAKRAQSAPDISTVAESGLPDFDVTPRYGVLTPIATPGAIVKLLNVEIGKILQLPDIQTSFTAQGLEAGGSSPEQFRQLMQAEIEKWAKVIKDAGIKGE
jgi:tripartite-type tricarboxylate transporter receptor subunit TctC